MTTKLYLPLLLLAAACGDNLEPGANDQATFGSEETPDEGSGSNEPRLIEAQIYVDAPSCDAAVARFEAEARYTDDGSPLTNISCTWTFDDGSTATDCAGEHAFEDGGFHDFVLEVTDLDTGAVARAEQNRFIDPVIDATLDVTTGDRTITVNADTNVGQTKVFVEPADLVVTDDPFYYLKRSYTVGVKRDGAYKVVLEVEDERPVGPICTKRIEKTVNVYCTGGEHTHPH